MPFLFLEDDRLYTDRGHCLARFVPPAPGAEPGLLRYHAILVGTPTDHHRLCLESLLATQSPPFEVHLWMSEPRAVPGVQVHRWDPIVESKGTAFEWDARLLLARDPVALSDGFRTLALAKWGGIYFDLDVLFLRDLRPLTAWDFVYQWSTRRWSNSAVMHMRPETGRRFARLAIDGNTAHPRKLLQFNAPAPDCLVLPVFLFDPLWPDVDAVPRRAEFPDFFDRRAPPVTLETFMPGAYTYHWHGQWDHPMKPGSAAAQIYQFLAGDPRPA